jgi:primosomal protein N'
MIMYISVIPTSKSHGRHPYSYHVPEIWQDQIVLSGLVEIPLGKHLESGIIVSIEDRVPSSLEEEAIKPIHSVLSSTPLLSTTNILTLIGVAEKYYLLIHKALALSLG